MIQIMQSEVLTEAKYNESEAFDETHMEYAEISYLVIPVEMDATENPNTCHICHKVSANKSTLKAHLKLHTGERPFQCDLCNKTFRQSGHLKEHLKIHTGEKPYKCNVCLKVFRKEWDLTRHTKTHCSNICQLCNKALKRKSQLKSHARTCIGERLYCTELWEDVVPSISDRCSASTDNSRFNVFSNNESCFDDNLFVLNSYNCNFCEKAFPNASVLKRHMSIHEQYSREKPYKCDVCNKAFRENATLKDHARIHTGEKPYKCNLCSRAFRKRCDLKRHTRLHTGEKPYNCSVCNKAFSDKSSLKWHNRIHTGNEIHRRTHRGQKLYMTGMGNCLDEEELLMTENPQDRSSVQSMNPSSNENLFSGDQSTISPVMEPFLLRSYGCGICDDMFEMEKEFMEHSSNHYDIPVGDTFIDLFECPFYCHLDAATILQQSVYDS